MRSTNLEEIGKGQNGVLRVDFFFVEPCLVSSQRELDDPLETRLPTAVNLDGGGFIFFGFVFS